jgi:hypothetical protein
LEQFDWMMGSVCPTDLQYKPKSTLDDGGAGGTNVMLIQARSGDPE